MFADWPAVAYQGCVCPFGRFCFCALHAHMRLTEALVKPMFARAIATNRVRELDFAFEKHLGLGGTFAQVQSEHGSGKVWKRVGFRAYECRLFSKVLKESATRPQEPAIHRVVHEVWPDSDQAGPLLVPQAPTRAGSRKRKPSHRDKEWGGRSEEQQREYKRQYLHLWSLFGKVMDQMRCRDPDREDLKHFGKNCRCLGARWCMMMPKNRCGALYLHTLTMHGGAFMEHLLPLKLTIGMLENSGAERRHQIGKVHFRKSLAGGGKQYSGMASHENRTAFLTIRGTLIWQVGRDLLAQEIASEEQRPASAKVSCRSRQACGYGNVLCKKATPSAVSSRELENQSVDVSAHCSIEPRQEGQSFQDQEMHLDTSEFLSFQDQEMHLDTSGFLNNNCRLERLEEDGRMDLEEELRIDHGELMDAVDEHGGLQVNGGEYITRLDFRSCNGSDDDSSVDPGSEDQDSRSGCSESGSSSEHESYSGF